MSSLLPAATQGDFTQVPITHSDPALESKSLDGIKIIPILVDWPALPSA